LDGTKTSLHDRVWQLPYPAPAKMLVRTLFRWHDEDVQYLDTFFALTLVTAHLRWALNGSIYSRMNLI